MFHLITIEITVRQTHFDDVGLAIGYITYRFKNDSHDCALSSKNGITLETLNVISCRFV
jgi:hypothetical protein